MTAPNPSTALARVLIDELVARGTGLVAISPGSRSAALAIAAAEHPNVETVVFLDERSAAFFALGHAKANGSPAVVLATSGTAPANWFPAVVEADSSCTPLVLISADRPARLRGVGANQTIDQVQLFGNKVRHFVDVPAPDHEPAAETWRELVGDSLIAALGAGAGSPGPVHLNISFEEPTVPVSDDGRSRVDPYQHSLGASSQNSEGDWEALVVPSLNQLGAEHPRRGLVIAGDGAYDRLGLLRAAESLGWPVLATALSGLRGLDVLGAYAHVLSAPLALELVPEVVVAVGAIGPNEKLEMLVASAGLRFRVDHWGRHFDPTLVGATQVAGDPVGLLKVLSAVATPDPEWSQRWVDVDNRVRQAMNAYLASQSVPSTAKVAWLINQVQRNLLVVASSLPIRAIDAHLVSSGPVVANRGASGIDGFISTALGAASGRNRTLAIAGDLSLFHDSNAWLNDGDQNLTVVVVNNEGGGLFDLLPQRQHAPQFERLFISPQHREVSDLASLHGLGFERAGIDNLTEITSGALEAGGRHLIEVKVDREEDLVVHRELFEVAAAAVKEV